MNLKHIYNIKEFNNNLTKFVLLYFPQRPFSPVLSRPLNHDALKDCSVKWPLENQWDYMAYWIKSIKYSFEKILRIDMQHVPQPSRKGIFVFKLCRHNRSYDVAIDCRDDHKFIDISTAERCLLYFKMQYDEKGYKYKNIFPAGLVSHLGEIYSYIPYLRKSRDKKRFIYDVYGRLDPRWGPDWDKDIRRKAYQLLSNSGKFKYGGGLDKVRFIQHVQEIAGSKICIDLPGDGDFCSRLADYFAVGACVIAVKYRTAAQISLVDREHIVYMKDDLSDLVDLCCYYLEHDDERERLCLNGRRFFDDHIHRNQLVAYYLEKFLERTD